MEKNETLIEKDGTVYVPISHYELDSLVGSLMQMCELMGDKEQREALKREIKDRARRWLDFRYECAGYEIKTEKVIK